MEDLQALIQTLNIGDEADRIYAAEDIGFANHPAGVAPLLARLDSEDSRAVRGAIFQALARIADEAVLKAAVRLLSSDDPDDRNQAVGLLQHAGARALPSLIATAASEDRDLRKLALDVIAGIGTPEAAALIGGRLEDRDPNVAITAVEQAGLMRLTEHRARIEALFLESRHPMLTGVCLEALSRIGDAGSIATVRRRFDDLGRVPDLFLPSLLKLIAAHATADEWGLTVNVFLSGAPHLRSAALDSLAALASRGCAAPISAALLAALRRAASTGESEAIRYQAQATLDLLKNSEVGGE